MYKMYLIEFSKIYKRLMELEHCLKENMFLAIYSYHKDTGFSKFKYFFDRLKDKDKYSKTILDRKNKTLKKVFILKEIMDDVNIEDTIKLQKCINCLYLSDFLKLLTKCLVPFSSGTDLI